MGSDRSTHGSVFDRRVAPAVSRAVQETVEQTGLSRLVESG